MFLEYTLIRLLSASQVVLWCNSSNIYLFFAGRAYMRPTSSGFSYLPEGPGYYNPPWALIDVDYRDKGAPVDGDSNIWPIQVSGPNPIQWKYWLRQTGGREWGMSLWSFTELLCGCAS